MKFEANIFQTKLLSRLSHKVCCPLCSPVLLRKLTTICFGPVTKSGLERLRDKRGGHLETRPGFNLISLLQV